MFTVHASTLLLLSGWIVALSIITVVALPLNGTCVTPGGNAGRCVPVRSCPFIIKLLNDVKTPADHNYVESFKCGKVADGGFLICCPRVQNKPDCGRITLKDNIVGGTETEIDEYPWMAALGYLNLKGNISFSCGGALIGERFVLTAAHCVDNIGKRQLTYVRLGEWDFSTAQDCNDGRCNEDPARNFSIAKVIKHESYDSQSRSREHDIALLKLNRPAPNTETISTICLPTVEMSKGLVVERESFDVAGWGALGVGAPSRSKRKMKVSLKGKSLDVCQSVYAIARVTLTENQLCVGGDDQKDSCRGDSGGPLMLLKNNRWHLAGVVSLGPQQCGSKGMPGIYTNVGRYLDWIVNKIELESRP